MWRLGAAAAATVLAISSAGDVFVLAAVLSLAGGDAVSVLAAGLAGAVVIVRLGSPALAGLAGFQAVLGPAGIVGPGLAASSSWLSAASLVLAAPGGIAAVPFGVAAGLVVAGPAVHSVDDLVTRLAAGVAGVALAWVAGRWLPRSWSWSAVALGAAAVVLVAIAR